MRKCLKVHWSKKENDLVFFYPENRKCDGGLIQSHFSNILKWGEMNGKEKGWMNFEEFNIIDELVKDRKKVYKSVKAKVDEDFENKIKFICSKTGVKEEDYLAKLLEASEIDKIYKELSKVSKNNTDNSTKVDENSN